MYLLSKSNLSSSNLPLWKRVLLNQRKIYWFGFFGGVTVSFAILGLSFVKSYIFIILDVSLYVIIIPTAIFYSYMIIMMELDEND